MNRRPCLPGCPAIVSIVALFCILIPLSEARSRWDVAAPQGALTAAAGIRKVLRNACRLPDQHQSSPVLAGPIRMPGHAVLWLDAGQADSWAFRDMADDCCSGLGSLRRCNSNTTSSCAAAAYQLYSTRYCLRNSYTYCLQTSRRTFDLLR